MTSEPTIDVLPSLDEIEELSIMVRLAGIAEPSHITWTEAELRFPSTRRSVVMILRGIALKLEQEQLLEEKQLVTEAVAVLVVEYFARNKSVAAALGLEEAF